MKKQILLLAVLHFECYPGIIFSNSETNNWDFKTKIRLTCSTAWYRVGICWKAVIGIQIFFFRNGCWSVTRKTPPLVQINVGFYFKVSIEKTVLSGCLLLYQIIYYIIFRRNSREKLLCNSCWKESQGSNKSFMAWGLSHWYWKKAIRKVFASSFPHSPSGFLALYSYKFIPSYKAYEVLGVMDSSLLCPSFFL